MGISDSVLWVHIRPELKVHARSIYDERMVQTADDIREAFSRRLNTALRMANIPEWGAGARLAEMTGRTPKAASKWINAETMPGRSSMLQIANGLGVRSEWLQYGKGSIKDENAALLGETDHTMPLIGWVKAGNWCESPDEFAPGDAEEWLPRPKNAGARSFALRVQNDSMTSPYPGQRSYPEGTIIYVDPDKPVTNGSRVVARAGGEYTFKQYVEDAGRKYLKPINPTYDKIDITEHTHICGVIIGSYLPE